MNKSADMLRWRREALLRRAASQRQELGAHAALIGATVDRADRGLAIVRRVATPPVLVASGIAVTFLLGRGRARRLLAAGLTVAGVFLRARTAGQLVAGLAGGLAAGQAGGQAPGRTGGQPVSRSR
ncbi:MAG: hypothetical protein JNK40_15620 [Chromatiales bacterium]|nr:hypothetical protein [Chromatiales bacterium]